MPYLSSLLEITALISSLIPRECKQAIILRAEDKQGNKFKEEAIKCCREKNSSPPNEWCKIPLSICPVLKSVENPVIINHSKFGIPLIYQEHILKLFLFLTGYMVSHSNYLLIGIKIWVLRHVLYKNMITSCNLENSENSCGIFANFPVL